MLRKQALVLRQDTQVGMHNQGELRPPPSRHGRHLSPAKFAMTKRFNTRFNSSTSSGLSAKKSSGTPSRARALVVLPYPVKSTTMGRGFNWEAERASSSPTSSLSIHRSVR